MEGACTVKKRVRSSPPKARIIPLDPEQTLYETGSREVWQSLVITTDGAEIGPVIRQVIEPRMYTIRYLVVHDLERERHILLPANTIVDITEDRVYSSLTKDDIAELPAFRQTMSKDYEAALYAVLRRTPYWLEEEAARRNMPPESDS